MTRVRCTGFTLAEVVVALVLVITGVSAMVGSAALAVRMAGWGRWSTVVAQVAGARIERLRGLAAATSPPCADPRLGSGTALTEGIGERWELGAVPGALQVVLVLDHRRPDGTARDTVVTAFPCR